MKKIFFVFLAVSMITACKTDDPTESDLIGKYKLIEVLADPGTGTGTFQPVTSNKTIEFHADGTITSNGDLCTSSIASNLPTSGTYSLVDSTIQSPDCQNNTFGYRFQYKRDEVRISYPCIEPCRAKYEKE